MLGLDVHFALGEGKAEGSALLSWSALVLWSTPIFLSVIGPPPRRSTSTHGQATITFEPITPREPYMTAYTVTHPATCQAPCPYPMEHPPMRVLLNGDVPRATPSREPTGRTQQSHRGCAALRAQASHLLWAWCPQRPHTYLDTPRVTHWTMASIPQL